MTDRRNATNCVQHQVLLIYNKHFVRSNAGRVITSVFELPFTPSLPHPAVGAADAKMIVPFGENTELKRSPFKAWSRSVYSHTCYAYCQGFFLAYFYTSGPFTCIFPKPLPIFPVLAVANSWFLCRPAE